MTSCFLKRLMYTSIHQRQLYHSQIRDSNKDSNRPETHMSKPDHMSILLAS